MSRIKRILVQKLGLLAAGGALLVAPLAHALEPASAEALDEGIEITRDAASLTEEMRPRPVDRDVADTALVFTNLGGADRKVVCVGFDGNGRAVGRAWVKLPRRGLRYVLASDLSNGADFVGSAHCLTSGHVSGSVVFLGPDLTDLRVEQKRNRRRGRIRFPVVATY